MGTPLLAGPGARIAGLSAPESPGVRASAALRATPPPVHSGPLGSGPVQRRRVGSKVGWSHLTRPARPREVGRPRHAHGLGRMPKSLTAAQVSAVRTAIIASTEICSRRLGRREEPQLGDALPLHGRLRRMGWGRFEWSRPSTRGGRSSRPEALADGIDPLTAKRMARASVSDVTFGVVAAEYIASRKASWRDEKRAARWESSLKTHAKNIWGLPWPRCPPT